MVTEGNVTLSGSGSISAQNMGTSRKQYQIVDVTAASGDKLTILHSPDPEHLRTARIYNPATKQNVANPVMEMISDEQTDITIPITGACSVIFEY